MRFRAALPFAFQSPSLPRRRRLCLPPSAVFHAALFISFIEKFLVLIRRRIFMRRALFMNDFRYSLIEMNDHCIGLLRHIATNRFTPDAMDAAAASAITLHYARACFVPSLFHRCAYNTQHAYARAFGDTSLITTRR